MDSNFQDLNSETIEVKVDETWKEISNWLAFFKQSQKKAEQETAKSGGKAGRRRPGEDEPGKRESPTVHLCSALMEQIEEFKVRCVCVCVAVTSERLVVSGRMCLHRSTSP